MNVKKLKIILFITTLVLGVAVLGVYFMPFVNFSGKDLPVSGYASGYGVTFASYANIAEVGKVKILDGSVYNITALGFIVAGLFASIFTLDHFMNHNTSKIISLLFFVVAAIMVIFTKNFVNVMCDDKIKTYYETKLSAEAAKSQADAFVKNMKNGMSIGFGTIICSALCLLAAGSNLASIIISKKYNK